MLGVSALGSAAVSVTSGPTVAEVGGILSQALAGGLCMWVGFRLSGMPRGRPTGPPRTWSPPRPVRLREAARITEFRSIARALHDTAINTLGVLRLPGYDSQALRERCREDPPAGSGCGGTRRYGSRHLSVVDAGGCPGSRG